MTMQRNQQGPSENAKHLSVPRGVINGYDTAFIIPTHHAHRRTCTIMHLRVGPTLSLNVISYYLLGLVPWPEQVGSTC